MVPNLSGARMKNILACLIVTLFLAACSAHVWTHTNTDLIARDRMSTDQRAEYLRHGGNLRGF